MISIGIDGNEANIEHRVGVGEYAYELLWQFSNLKSQISNLKFTIYLKDKPKEDLPKEQEGWEYRIVGPRKLWTQIGLPFDLYKHRPRPDVFFTPTHYAPRVSPVPSVISVMDLSFVHYPEMFRKSDLYQLTNWTRYSVLQAKKIFTISLASKNDIIKYYHVASEKVVVTYPGFKPKAHMSKTKSTTQTVKLLKQKYKIEGSYILFVGTIQPRKNLTRLIEAFSKLDKPDIDLVLVGKKGWLYEEIFDAPRKFGVPERVKFLDYVPDEDLPLLYQNATCFILPSLYEGFGLPVLEAMSHGCPCVLSNTSSLPEVGGDGALYVDPTSITSIKEALEKVVKDASLRKKLIEKGYQQVKKFSWEKTARETLKVLEEVVKEHN